MIILSLRTDNPGAEIGLFEDDKQLAYESWQAHRQLAETLHIQIEKLLRSIDKDWNDIDGVMVYRGPGSFTGLRIGISVANALAASLAVSIVGKSGASWREDGIKSLLSGANDKQILPEYGAEVHITKAKQ